MFREKQRDYLCEGEKWRGNSGDTDAFQEQRLDSLMQLCLLIPLFFFLNATTGSHVNCLCLQQGI